MNGKERVPYIGFGNDELKDAPGVKEGDKVPCPICGELTLVKNSEPPSLQFISHCGKIWLAGVGNKYVGNKIPSVSGELSLDDKDMENEMSEIEKLVDEYFTIEEKILSKIKDLPTYGEECDCNDPNRFCIVDDDVISCFCINCGGEINY